MSQKENWKGFIAFKRGDNFRSVSDKIFSSSIKNT